MSNWKTTVAGIVGALIALAGYMHWLTPEVCAALTALATALGLYHAQDQSQPS